MLLALTHAELGAMFAVAGGRAVWLWPYLLGMGAISYLSSFDTGTPSSIPLIGLQGPRDTLTFGWDALAVALFSLFLYAFAIRCRLSEARSHEYATDLTAEAFS